MCHDTWMRRERRREERFQEELRYLLDEHERSAPAAPVVKYERDEAPTDPERLGVEAGTRAERQALGGATSSAASARPGR